MKFLENLEPRHAWHPDVEQHHVDRVAFEQLQQLFSVRSFACDLDAGGVGQHVADPLAYNPVIIGDDEPLEQPLFIPSCESSGLKIKGGTFVVPAEGEAVATIQLTTDASIQTIDWNTQGFRIDPVMRIRNGS